ncbi:hypothetical protein [Nonomuraea sp. NPDC050310]|uniref:hypothetical protein n=1 Tax=Nonomuraea sp. NPDC050310 TaxID=3154935 RepID=UPI003406F771
MADTSMSVPLEGVIDAVAAQRNAALDEVAQLRAVLRGVVEERDKYAAELQALKD